MEPIAKLSFQSLRRLIGSFQRVYVVTYKAKTNDLPISLSSGECLMSFFAAGGQSFTHESAKQGKVSSIESARKSKDSSIESANQHCNVILSKHFSDLVDMAGRNMDVSDAFNPTG